MRNRGSVPVLVAAVALAVVAAACGARVTSEQVASVGGTAGISAPSGVRASGGSSAAGDGFGVGAAGVAPGDAAAAPGRSRTPGAAASAASADGGPAATGSAADVERTASDVGVTPETIRLGHVTELSGPVPGLFAGSVVGLQAFVAYQNSVGGIAGRTLEAVIRDDQFDATTNRNVTRELIRTTFALVGGISLFDDASAADVAESGLPDVTTAISNTRAKVPNNFAPSPNIDGAPTGPWRYLKQRYPQVVTPMASLYGDVPAAKRVHDNYRSVAEGLGFEWVYDRGYQPTETDYTADIIRMRQAGAKALFLMSVDAKNVARILKAAEQQGWEPEVAYLGASSYDRAMTTLAGSAAEGVQLFLPYSLFAGEDGPLIPEVRLFNTWVQQVKPGSVPDGYAAGAWMAGRLLAAAMAETGPNPTRADVVAALRAIDTFDANGMMAPTGPGAKRPATCFLVAEFTGGKFRRVEPDRGYRCEGTFVRR